MSDELFILHGAPTLAGIKTGNLFSCACTGKEELFTEIRRVNRMLAPKGLRLLPMRISDGRALLYLFRPSRLGKDLKNRETLSILKEAGYTNFQQGPVLRELISRLKNDTAFPHEIGLFLSYPPEDVRGFIENHACDYKCAGPWKVYGDAEAAAACAARYQACTKTYCSMFQGGKSLTDLAVAM